MQMLRLGEKRPLGPPAPTLLCHPIPLFTRRNNTPKHSLKGDYEEDWRGPGGGWLPSVPTPPPRSLGRGARISEVGTDPSSLLPGALGDVPMSCPCPSGGGLPRACVPHPSLPTLPEAPCRRGLPLPDHNQHSPSLGTPGPSRASRADASLCTLWPWFLHHHNHACLPTNLGVSERSGLGPAPGCLGA